MKKILINGLPILGEVEYTEERNKETDEILKNVKFATKIKGNKNFSNFSNTIDNSKINIELPDDNIVFIAKKGSSSFSYTHCDNEDDIQYSYEITFNEISKNTDSEWNTLVGVADINIMNWARTRAISELLIEKGLFTTDEYHKKIIHVRERDHDEFIDYMTKGKLKIKEEIGENL